MVLYVKRSPITNINIHLEDEGLLQLMNVVVHKHKFVCLPLLFRVTHLLEAYEPFLLNRVLYRTCHV